MTDRRVLHPGKQYFSAGNENDTFVMNGMLYQGLNHEFYQKAASIAKEVAGDGRSWEDILCSVLMRNCWKLSCGLSKALEIMRELQDFATWGHALFEAYRALPRGSYIREHLLDFGDPTVVDWHEQNLHEVWPLMRSAQSMGLNKEIISQVFKQQIRGNRIVNTSMKVLATVPEHTEEGDQIWIIYGCSTPLLLRPTERGYLLVGAGFVDGVMDGQALKRNMGLEEDASLV